jgi:hypothetical protein
MPYNQDTEFVLFGVRTWEIWCRQGRTVNKENLDEPDFMETKFPSLQGRSRARQDGARPKAPQGHKYNPLGTQGGIIDPSNHLRATETKEKHREEADGRRKSSSCLGDGLGHALVVMVGHAW